MKRLQYIRIYIALPYSFSLTRNNLCRLMTLVGYMLVVKVRIIHYTLDPYKYLIVNNSKIVNFPFKQSINE